MFVSEYFTNMGRENTGSFSMPVTRMPSMTPAVQCSHDVPSTSQVENIRSLNMPVTRMPSMTPAAGCSHDVPSTSQVTTSQFAGSNTLHRGKSKSKGILV